MASYSNSLGLALWFLGRPAEALGAFARAVEIDPDDPDYQRHWGDALTECRRHAEAAAAYRVALAHSRMESRAPLLARLAAALANDGRVRESSRYWVKALALDGRSLLYANNLAGSWFLQGQVSRSLRAYRELVECADCPPQVHSNFAFASLFHPALSPETVFLRHKGWAERYELNRKPLASLRKPARRRIRIGYCSPDLRNHSVSFFLRPILAAHDRQRFEIYCYSNAMHRDATTEEFGAMADRWRDIGSMDDRAVAKAIREDRIDLLVDLAGHTSGNRLPVFAYKPAPVQATYLGYPATTGLSRMDFRITDGVADPPGMTEELHSEKLWRLAPCFLCYEPPADAPPVRLERDGGIRFGSFAMRLKINRRVIRLWAEVLRQVAGAELLLKGKGYDEVCQRQIRKMFAERDVDPQRIVFRGFQASRREHLAAYGGVDITLDTFPYNGTTTTCEALWMGSPVLTLAGNSHVSRVSASILTQAGLSDWVARDEEDFVRCAVEAAGDGAGLARLRRSLRRRLKASALLDGAGFTRRLEDAYRAMIDSPDRNG